MSISVTIHDKAAAGKPISRFSLVIYDSRVTARDLIGHRIRDEVGRFNADPAGRFGGLVEPTEAERILNPATAGERRRIDPDAQVKAAVEGFERNAFVLLVGDRQITDIDEVIDLTPDTDISFIKLVPLKGG